MPHEAAMAAALLDPDCSAPQAIAAGDRSRFAVYRNNVTLGLTEALAARFPAVRKTVGAEFFAKLARVFVSRHPPASPIMTFYGEDFADFIDAFPACADLPYLGDLARLEASRTRAYHSADVAPLGAETLARLKPEALASLRLALHPAVAIVASPHPIVTIWAMNIGDMPLAPIADWHGEDALVARPKLDVEVRRLPLGGAVFLSQLAQSECLGDAAAAAFEATPDFDLAVNLAGLFANGLVAGILS
jgi:Putative DNA-binding domain